MAVSLDPWQNIVGVGWGRRPDFAIYTFLLEGAQTDGSDLQYCTVNSAAENSANLAELNSWFFASDTVFAQKFDVVNEAGYEDQSPSFRIVKNGTTLDAWVPSAAYPPVDPVVSIPPISDETTFSNWELYNAFIAPDEVGNSASFYSDPDFPGVSFAGWSTDFTVNYGVGGFDFTGATTCYGACFSYPCNDAHIWHEVAEATGVQYPDLTIAIGGGSLTRGDETYQPVAMKCVAGVLNTITVSILYKRQTP